MTDRQRFVNSVCAYVSGAIGTRPRITIQQAADYAGVSWSHMQRHLVEKRLPRCSPGGQPRKQRGAA